jgi:hypothetical protein
MLAKTYILHNLNALNKKYNKATTPKDSLFFSKLAILELCGWIEESMDDLVRRCAKQKLKEQANITYVNSVVIKKNYGFEYQNNFRQMLIKLLGIINVERIERKMDAGKFQRFQSTLSALKTARDAEAHTHIKGITRSINAPSITLRQFNDVYDGLAEVDMVIRASKL